MKQRAVVLSFSLLAFVFCAAVADDDVTQRQIELQITPSIQINYAPFSGLPSAESLQLQLSVQDPSNGDGVIVPPRPFIIRFRPTDLGSFSAVGEQLQLPITMTSSDNQPFENINNEYQHQVNLDLSSSEPQVFNYSFSISESLYADKGFYSLNLDVELLDRITQETIGSIQSVDVEVMVAAKLQTNIAGTRGAYEAGTNFSVIDFGTLETGEMRRVFIQVRGNTPAELTVSSENAGRMRNTLRSSLYVDYTVVVDGEFSTLETPLKLPRTVARDLQGSAYPMEVTIGDMESSFAGNYQDIIQVDVDPQ